MRFRFIEDRRADYPVTLMCGVLGVSPAGYYAWRARPESPRAAANRELVDDIKRIHRDTNGRYGSPRVHAELRAQGRGASRGRIERLMRRHGIRAIMARPRRVRTTDSHHDFPIAPNLLERNFIAAAPNRIWLADITYVETDQGWLYLATVMDLYSRKIVGCSTGGRMAALEAQRYPDDFDGIISGAPALDYTGLVATHFAWLVQANTGPEGKDILTKAKVPLIRDAVAKQCGDATGLVTDPAACTFKPASLICKPGQNSQCLSAAEAEVLEKWYAGPRNSRGEQVYPGGLPKGSEPYWPVWLTGLEPNGGKLIYSFGLDFLRYMAFQDDPGERYGVADFDFDRDPPRLAFMAAIYNAMNPDLSRFKARGGKLLMYHELADPIVTPQNTLDYYAAAEKAAGGSVADHFRLFMIPGMDHCGIPTQAGPGINEAGFDPLSALEKWVEDSVAPNSMLATKTDRDGKVLWTRPLCAFPKKATYLGAGEVQDAGSYRCE